MGASACLYSTVKNISGGKIRVPFIDNYGRDMANNETYSELGHPTQWIKRWRNWTPSLTAALKSCIEGNLVALIQTPSVVLNDVVDNQQLILQLNDSKLRVADKCTGSPVVSFVFSPD